MLISLLSYSQEAIIVDETNKSIIVNNITYLFTQQDFLDLTVNAKTACFKTVDKKYIFKKTTYEQKTNELLILWGIVPLKQVGEKCHCIYEKVKYKTILHNY